MTKLQKPEESLNRKGEEKCLFLTGKGKMPVREFFWGLFLSSKFSLHILIQERMELQWKMFLFVLVAANYL